MSSDNTRYRKKRERGRKNFEAWTLQENLKAGDP